MAQPVLKLGSTDPAVTDLQNLLNQAGFSVPVTGIFDAKTDAVVRAFQQAKGLTADGVVGPKTWGALTGQPSFTVDSKAAFGRTVLENVWQQVTGEAPNLAELQIAGAQAHLESFYGLSNYTNKLTGEKSGVINNWGAVQGGGSGPKGKPPCPPGGFETTDTHADGTPYNMCYKIYPTPEAGAADMLKEMTVRRPTSWNNMKRGDIDAWAASMRTTDPITKVGLYFEQSVEGRASGIASRVNNIAGTLGEPVAAKRGGPVDPGTAMGQTPTGEDGGTFDGVSGKKLAGPTVILLGLAGLAATVWKWGWPWTWDIPKMLGR